MKIQRSFHKTDPTRTLNGLQFIKPWKIKITGANTRLHAWLQASEIAASSFRPMQICSEFQKTDNTRRSTRRSADHQRHFTRSHAPIRASHSSPWCLTRSHAPLQLYDVMMMSLPTFSLTRFLGTDSNRWPGPNRLRKKALTKFDFDFDQKVKNFKKRPVPLSFSRTFRFWNPFLCSRLENCANCPISKSWLLHKSWPKCQNFQEWPVCLIFCVDSNFGVYFFIQESEIAQIVWFYSCWP